MLTPGFRKLVRSASDVQPSPSSLRGSRGLCDWYQRGSSLAVNIKSGTSTPDTGHQSLSPENSSSGCDTGPEDFSPHNVFVDEASGMRGLFVAMNFHWTTSCKSKSDWFESSNVLN